MVKKIRHFFCNKMANISTKKVAGKEKRPMFYWKRKCQNKWTFKKIH